MSSSKTALLVGATGLVGNSLLFQLLNDSHYAKVITLVRRRMNLKHAKLEERIVDFDQLNLSDCQADDVFCCLGTTIRQAGSQEAFRKVDFEYPLRVAQLAKQAGAKQFVMVTALGSDAQSGIFYNRVKGEVEKAITAVGFDTLHICRPSLLLGTRKESRFGEGIGKVFAWLLGPFMLGSLKKYKGIQGSQVAAAMLAFAKTTQPGTHVHESDALQAYGSPFKQAKFPRI